MFDTNTHTHKRIHEVKVLPIFFKIIEYEWSSVLSLFVPRGLEAIYALHWPDVFFKTSFAQ